MKKILAVLALILAVSTLTFAQGNKPVKAAAETKVTKATGPVIQFEATEINYGTIAEGSDPFRVFKFKNTGAEPLVITDARGSCGCTVPSYSNEPILPGKTGEIKVRYDTTRPGPFTKTITLTTNAAEPTTTLIIKGEVKKKEAEPSGLPAKEGSMFNNGN